MSAHVLLSSPKLRVVSMTSLVLLASESDHAIPIYSIRTFLLSLFGALNGVVKVRGSNSRLTVIDPLPIQNEPPFFCSPPQLGCLRLSGAWCMVHGA